MARPQMRVMCDAGDATRAFNLHNSLFEDALPAPRKDDRFALCVVQGGAKDGLHKSANRRADALKCDGS